MKKYQNELSAGVFVLFGLLCIAYLTVKLGDLEIFDDGGYNITAKFTKITGLRNGANVDLAGVNIGKVTSVKLSDGPDYRAVLNLHIDKGIELSDDAIASIKTNGLIGDKYIEISQGGSETSLMEGSELEQTNSPVDFEELISKYVFGNVGD